jgi:thioredoxin reductase
MSDMLTPDLCIIGDSAAGLRAALLAGAFGVPTVLVKSTTCADGCRQYG